MSDKQGWTGGPQDRGTFEILWTCLSTLTLCVWTAVHPNILVQSSSRKAILARVWMMMVAIVFPELIISSTWRQLRSTQFLRAQINHLYDKRDNTMRGRHQHQTTSNDLEPQQALLPSFEFEPITDNVAGSNIDVVPTNVVQDESIVESEKLHEDCKGDLQWNSEQAFFAVMGGYVVENEYLNESNKIVIIRRLVTVDGVLQLARLGLMPAIGPDDISERSKADSIAKMFVLSQITWFGLQVIGRLASKLPVTPLEIHAAIHVACTIVMYFLWMKKPYDVRGSILLKDPDAKSIGALCNFYQVISDLHAKALADYEIARATYWRDRVVRAANDLLDYDPPPEPPAKEPLTKAVQRYTSITGGLAANATTAREHILVALAPTANRGMDLLRRRGRFSDDSINSQSWKLLRDSSENFAIKAVWGGWSTNTGHEMSLDKAVHFLFNFLYGGGHLCAWASSAFPTDIEHWLWIASALMLTCIPLLGTLWILWWKAVGSKKRWLYPIRNGNLDIVAAPFFFVVMLAYFLARCYFLIESLISLRLLPTGAFLTVNWARYLPHVA